MRWISSGCMLPQPSLMLIPFGSLCAMATSAPNSQNARCRFVSGAICDIHSDAHFLERHSLGKTCLREFHITTERVIDSCGSTNVVRGRTNRVDLAIENEVFDFFLDLIIQLVTVVPKKFDAVVLVRIM